MKYSAVTPALFISLLVLALIAWALVAVRRARCTWAQAPLFFVGFWYVKLIWRAKLLNPADWTPPEGAIVIANHTSSVDPFFVQLACDRVVHWMIAREFVEHALWGPMVRIWKVIPANRGGVDTTATREAIRVAQGGGIVGIFPEGRINMTEEFLLPFRPGAALIAARASVPIVPIYIEEAPYDRFPHSPFMMPAQVRVHVGQAVQVRSCTDERDSHALAEAMHNAMGQIAAMAGKAGYPTKMAGRDWKPTREETLRVMEESYRRRLSKA